ncbi:hypothetical protein Cco03nite_40200 [Catellatospora coxensis]|uniref:Uncharacterized protein n=1 Tax=Catellatospora coxensis TaxID=310354 RepID=A0A8J3L6I4_9ACTN|nr:hypothetical protein Cco03nite_40200 [Catellatospora coxensis]
MSINDPQPLPGAVPSSGFLPPDDAFPVERASGPEVLVNLPGEGLTGWARKVAGVLRRGWQQQLAIFAITHALPGFVLYALAVGGLLALWDSDLARAAAVDDVLAEKLTVRVLMVVCLMLVVALPFRLLGYAAATWSAVRQAAGLPVQLSRALWFGLRRVPAMFAWSLVAYVLAFVVVFLVVLCFASAFSFAGLVPAVIVLGYLVMIAGMVGPAVLFEHRRPLVRAFDTVNSAFWPAVVRLAVPGVVLFLAYRYNQVIDGAAAMSGFGGTIGERAGFAFAAVAASAALELPVAMLLFPTVLVTYVERRAQVAPNLRTPHLLDELG